MIRIKHKAIFGGNVFNSIRLHGNISTYICLMVDFFQKCISLAFCIIIHVSAYLLSMNHPYGTKRMFFSTIIIILFIYAHRLFTGFFLILPQSVLHIPDFC